MTCGPIFMAAGGRTEPLANPTRSEFEVPSPMRSLSSSFVLVGVLTLGTATAALAAPPHSGCPTGPSGVGGSTIGAWQPMTLAELRLAIAATGGDPAQADGEFARNDRNGDGTVCTMTQVLPNDASGDDTWFVSRDNIAAR